MPTIFPTWPNILFGTLEPISLLLGAAAPLVDLHGFIAGQTPKTVAPAELHPSSIALAYQLGNLYALLFMIGVAVCHGTSEPKVLRNYLVALAIADVGHVYATYVAMGWDAFVDISSWNALTWGNIGATAFLFANRLGYFMGIFGYAKLPKLEEKTA
ncbi:hypothetical protein ASPZODRAFT_74326 [Penicilliopsis zonata CBS 506.65]|uniref:DUF7704 domain-containing protein n=1 Tax=Penicilliopsis zonata CBS 506.65 TaxID=1073090 RepID=A0A1L9S8I6_9EURO|nr:hypothetical protein ASPZODRAFT_74326 [Penicilliopsis zonata CBS 506.65]OJJ43472.1 hypothetical protein ASPZODRAFT_74326 [Penicilliopsis zonata CBS 506.65]